MKKASTIILWISLGIGLLYAIASVVGALVGGMTSPIDTSEGFVYTIGVMYQIARTVLPLTGMLMLTLVILFTMKSKSENIVAEIIAIILYSGIGSLLSIVLANVMNIIIANIGNSEALATYSYMNMGANWVSFLGSVSRTLFIIGVSFAIAHKKVELADLRRLMEEEQL